MCVCVCLCSCEILFKCMCVCLVTVEMSEPRKGVLEEKQCESINDSKATVFCGVLLLATSQT